MYVSSAYWAQATTKEKRVKTLGKWIVGILAVLLSLLVVLLVVVGWVGGWGWWMASPVNVVAFNRCNSAKVAGCG